MPKKTREMPAAAKPRPQRKRQSQHYKANTVAKTLKVWKGGERGLARKAPPAGLVKKQTREYKDGRNPDHLKKLQPWHRAVARSRVLEGLSVTQLARKFERSRTFMGKVVASPVFKDFEARLEAGIDEEIASVQQDIQRMAIKGVEVLDADLDMPVPDIEHRKVRQSAAKDVLDRAGFIKRGEPGVPSQQTNFQMNVVAKMSVEELYEHADRMFRSLRSQSK